MDDERSRWDKVTHLMGDKPVALGQYVSYWFSKTPRRALNYMSYYKFAAKMIGRNKRVLDVGCNEGLGTWLLAVECGFAKGIDLDEGAVRTAKANWEDPRVQFHCGDFLREKPEAYDAAVSFDVIEHISPDHVGAFMTRLTANLGQGGVCVIGTPNLNGQVYASAVSKAGHVNVYSAEGLEKEMLRYFKHVFLFAANDEVVHTGFFPMAHYLIAVGCGKKPVPGS
jgi:2-polyprenyl-3-methyl-5-hydroxy-6-metoxy-1,4-benzoquinol methylase